VNQKINSLQGLRMVLFLMIFMFHLSAFEDIANTAIYQKLFAGGGTEAVAIFFVLSGFVEAIHDHASITGNAWKGVYKRYRKLKPLHIFFLVLSIPTHIVILMKAPINSFLSLIANILLIQSWFPDEAIWLGYNGVSWFLSTLLFLSLFSGVLHKISNYIERCSSRQKLYSAVLVLLCTVVFLIATRIDSTVDIKYWLYAFPPIRVIDYASGFVLGRLYKRHRFTPNKNLGTFLEVCGVIVLVIYLIVFRFVPVAIRRAALYLPGALYIIYIFSLSSGYISKLLSSGVMVYLGNGTLYYMMSHQVILLYCMYGAKLQTRITGHSNSILWIITSFIIMIASRPLYEKIQRKINFYFGFKI